MSFVKFAYQCCLCPEMQSGGFCHGNDPEVCNRKVDDIIKYAEALADWVTDFRQKHGIEQ